MVNLTGIKCIGPVFDASGYAEWCRSYILSLVQAGIPVTIGTDPVRKTGRPITIEGVHPDLGEKGVVLESLVDKDIDYNVVISWLIPSLAVEQMANEVKAKRIVMTLFETSTLHPTWAKYCSLLDEVWLPGDFNKEVFISSFDSAMQKDPSLKKLKNIPVKTFRYPIDFDDYETSVKVNLAHPETKQPLADDTYIFYAISQWSERKNFSDLLEAFWAEFTAEDNVVLFLKTYGRDYSAPEHQKIQNIISTLSSYCNKSSKLPPVAVIRNLLSKQQMLALHKRCNCYVSSSRGEGLGLGILEAGLFENPVITHKFGEQSSYINDDTGIIYGHTLRPVTKMGRNSWYMMDQNWAAPDVCSLKKSMRYVFEHREESNKKGKNLKKFLLENCTYDKISASIVESLEGSLANSPVEGYKANG